jgi:ornithine--oxo-acid transaminase
MSFDLLQLLEERAAENFTLHEQHLNSPFVKVLKTIGFDRRYVRAQGQYLFDQHGERYLDLLSGFGVFALGRNHPTIKRALHAVLEADLPNLVQLDAALLPGLLAERLLERIPGQECVFFCNSGTEAVEGAIKMARAATRRKRIVCCEHAFHGLTLGSLSLNGDPIFRDRFEPLLADVSRVPWNDLPALERALRAGDVAAFVVEPVQGKGVNLPAVTGSSNYLADAAQLCRKHGALFVADEVQTGLGRTGRFLAIEHYGVEPDLVLLAKALSGGFVPVGAVVGKRFIFDKLFDRMERAVVHGSTFGKNNLAMAAGLASLAVLEEEQLVERAKTRGDSLLRRLGALVGKYEMLKEVRGQGLMIALEFGPPKSLRLKTAWTLLETANKGLFCQTIIVPLFKQHRILSQVAGHDMCVIKLLPPLCISAEDEDWIVEAFDKVLAQSHELPGAAWDLATTLAKNTFKAQAGA